MSTRQPKPQNSPDPIGDLLDEKSLADEISKAIEGNDCPGDKELLAYNRKELNDAERVEVKSHLIFCTRCQKRANQIETEAPLELSSKTQAPKHGKSFRGFNITIPEVSKKTLLNPKFLAAAGAGLVLLIGLSYFLIPSKADFPYSGKIVFAEGSTYLRRGERLFYMIRTPQPIYLIEITIDGDGQINSRIAPGPKEGEFQDGERLEFVPKATGEFDLYLVPCPVSEGFPNSFLNGVLKFIKTENSISRENQRKGIEMALSLYRARFIHETYQIHP